MTEQEAEKLRRENPNQSYCVCCGVPWDYCESKAVKTDEHSGTFATCVECWEKSTLNDLKIYYKVVYRNQTEFGKMPHTLHHLLNCVEVEYNRTRNEVKL